MKIFLLLLAILSALGVDGASRTCVIHPRTLDSQIKAVSREVAAYEGLSQNAYHDHDMVACRHWDGVALKLSNQLMDLHRQRIAELEKESRKQLEEKMAALEI